MKETQTALEEVETLIRARYPIIYIVSWEEQRVQDWLVELAKKRNKRLFEWSYSTGIVPAGTSIQSQRARSSASKDPLNALDQVIEQVEPSIYIFKDLHPFLSRNNFAVIRRLKEIAVQLKNSYKTIMLLSPVLELPQELEKEVTVVDFPLPEQKDLSVLLDRIIGEVKQQPNVRIEMTPEAREKLLRSAMGLTLSEAENVFAKVLVHKGRLTEEDIEAVFSEKRQIIRKSGLLDYYEADIKFDQVGGLDFLKDWLRKRSLAFSDKARTFGLPPPKGVMLLGVQGCGKSLCAKAVASSWRMPLLRLDLGRMFGSLVGSSEENVRRSIRVAESIAPVVLWIDEIEKGFAGTKSSGMTDSGTTARVFGTFLTWMSEKKSSVFVIATANDITDLPPEFLRKGRFDEIFFVDLPNSDERRQIFRIHLGLRGRDPAEFDIERLAQVSVGFSGAEIEEAVVSALYDAFAEARPLGTAHIEKSIRETVPLSRTMENEINRLRSWADGRARPASPREGTGGAIGTSRKLEL